MKEQGIADRSTLIFPDDRLGIGHLAKQGFFQCFNASDYFVQQLLIFRQFPDETQDQGTVFDGCLSQDKVR